MGTDISVALTLFSVFAPAGAIAFLMVSLLVIAPGKKSLQNRRLERWLIIPLSVCLAGLVASATHLGSPANALYVLEGCGRSPLSNEVVGALAFLLVAGLYWISAFFKRPLPRWGANIWLVTGCLLALHLVGRISVVYSIPTIETWSSPLVPFTLWLIAFVSGPCLAVVTVVFAERTKTAATRLGENGSRKDSGAALRMTLFVRAALVMGTIALILNVGLLVVQYLEFAEMSNSLGSALALAPWYGYAIAGYAILSAAGIVPMICSVFAGKPLRRSVAAFCMASVLLGACLVRVGFYSLRMTIGF